MAKEGWTYEELRSSLKKKEFAPVYLLYGEEDFLVDEAVNLVLDAALTNEERGFNLDIMYGSESDARDIVSHASSFPMMSERRVVIVREMDKLSNKELLASYIEKPLNTTSIVLLSTKPDFRRKPYVTAKKHGKTVEFRPLYENQVPTWIARRAKQQGREIDADACKLLAAYIGNSLRDIESELQKLFIYTGSVKTIRVDDVMTMVGVSREYNIFELQKTLGARNVERSIFIMEHMLEAGESPTSMIIMLTRFFAILWKLHDMVRRGVPGNEQAAELGVSPYYIKEYHDAVSVFSSSEVEQGFEHLADTDEQLKSTATDPALLMHLLLLKLFSIPARAPVAQMSE